MIAIGLLLGFVIAMFVSHVWAIGLAFAMGTVLGWGSHKRMVSNMVNGVLDRVKK